ncbi:MAG: methionyl-tRNA formyltransferase [Actinomycetota bacterium]|nr:methionyl-tRNA formyltransferase [Actinomycetota bacterium]
MPGWKVVLVSQVLPAVLGFDAGLRAAGHEAVALLTTRRDPADRDRYPMFEELIAGAPPHLDVVIPHHRTGIAPLLAAYEPDLVLCNGFPWRIPGEALAIPRLGLVNGHPSLLPRWRGPSPVAWAMRAGDEELGFTFHRMDEDFDTGPVLAQGSVPLEDHDDGWDTLGDKVGPLAFGLMQRVLERLEAGDPGDPQTGESSYAPFFGDDYVPLDWNRPAREVHNQVRAWRFMPFEPAGGVRGPIAELGGRPVRVLRTRLVPGEGERVDCADGPIWVLESEAVA